MIQGEQITIPVPEFRTHLQFRRFAGCPGCNLHLQSIAQRHDEILGADLREVVVFYSSAQAMKPHQGDLPGRRPSRAPPMFADVRKYAFASCRHLGLSPIVFAQC